MSRGAWDFSKKTKERAIQKSGFSSEDVVEVHHRISVAVARERGLSPALISSLWNAVVMLAEDHKKLHKNGGGMGEEYAKEAEEAQPRLF